jgi:4-diphosphocytidyl-2-C-methyl-D-erythritol kinase
VLAPAKLTLSLRVVGRRPDGYHLVEAEMVTVDLADRLAFGPGDGIEVGGPAAAGVPVDGSNLVVRALALAGRRASVRLEKRIPAGAGLGGGSADAAAALRWSGWATAHGAGEAAVLGADVPFCLVGGRARVAGIGEVVEPLPFELAAFTVLVPPLAVPTALVYRAWDELGGPSGRGSNDLEPAALAVVPELAGWRDRLAAASGERPRLAGSGATWFVPGEHPGDGLLIVRSVPRGWEGREPEEPGQG